MFDVLHLQQLFYFFYWILLEAQICVLLNFFPLLNEFNSNKKYILDFDIKGNNEVRDEPDIVEIVENSTLREPQVFIEIKNTSENDRWIGLTEE